MNWPKENAPAYLNRVLEHYKKAEWIPNPRMGIVLVEDTEVSRRKTARVTLLAC